MAIRLAQIRDQLSAPLMRQQFEYSPLWLSLTYPDIYQAWQRTQRLRGRVRAVLALRARRPLWFRALRFIHRIRTPAHAR